MNKPDGFKPSSAIRGGIVMVAIVMIIVFVIIVALGLHDKNTVDVEKCAILIESQLGVINALKELNTQYELAEIKYKQTNHSEWIKMTPETMPENMKELNQKRLEGAEILSTQKKFMDEYNCW